MTFPASWCDALFAKLTLRYGAAFMRQYQDLDVALVKADWCEVLDGFEKHPDAIKHALATLPGDKPPNAMQFRTMARNAPAQEAPKLPEPPADPARVAAAIEQLQSAKPAPRRMTLAQECAAGLRKRMADGIRLNEAQRAMLSACEGRTPEHADS